MVFTSFLHIPAANSDLNDQLDELKEQAKVLEDELLAASKVVQSATKEFKKIEAQIPKKDLKIKGVADLKER